MNKSPTNPTLDLDAITHALTADPDVCDKLRRDYGLSADLSGQALIDALLREFDQAPADDPFEEMRRPETVFRAAVRALGSNSRNWVTFAKGEPELAELLDRYDPATVHERVLAGALAVEDLIAFFPGLTGSKDAKRVLQWAARLSERDFGVETRAVADALNRLHRDQHGEPISTDHRMPTIVLLLADPAKSWGGWDLLPDELGSLTAEQLKLPGMGATLGSELFRNLRWSGFKPDRHVKRLLDRWTPEVVEAQEPSARRLAAIVGRRGRDAMEFLQYSLAGQAVTPEGTPLSIADNLMWALGAYVEKKGKESDVNYVRQSPMARRRQESIGHLVGYCVDVGSVQGGRFGWARMRLDESQSSPTTGTSMEALVSSLARDLKQGEVTLGFEYPLFIPRREQPVDLTKRRCGEGGRPWSAGAGVSSMGTGIAQTLWILSKLRDHVDSRLPVFLSWSDFKAAERGLHIWEAFVTGASKTAGTAASSSDEQDARRALLAFRDALPDPSLANSIHEDRVFSVIGAVLLQSGWTDDSGLLSKPCLVIRPQSGANGHTD